MDDIDKLLRKEVLADNMKSAARTLLAGMKASPGGDSYEYHGSMFAVEWLMETVADYENLDEEWDNML